MTVKQRLSYIWRIPKRILGKKANQRNCEEAFSIHQLSNYTLCKCLVWDANCTCFETLVAYLMSLHHSQMLPVQHWLRCLCTATINICKKDSLLCDNFLGCFPIELWKSTAYIEQSYTTYQSRCWASHSPAQRKSYKDNTYLSEFSKTQFMLLLKSGLLGNENTCL